MEIYYLDVIRGYTAWDNISLAEYDTVCIHDYFIPKNVKISCHIYVCTHSTRHSTYVKLIDYKYTYLLAKLAELRSNTNWQRITKCSNSLDTHIRTYIGYRRSLQDKSNTGNYRELFLPRAINQTISSTTKPRRCIAEPAPSNSSVNYISHKFQSNGFIFVIALPPLQPLPLFPTKLAWTNFREITSHPFVCICFTLQSLPNGKTYTEMLTFFIA